MAWRDGLSPEQERAANAVEKYARLLAGTGTGKTRTLTNRVAYLQEEQNVAARDILVLTFGRGGCSRATGPSGTARGATSHDPHPARVCAATTSAQRRRTRCH
jgi:hypothetical protein